MESVLTVILLKLVLSVNITTFVSARLRKELGDVRNFSIIGSNDKFDNSVSRKVAMARRFTRFYY